MTVSPPRALRVLLVEDSATDADLIQRELRRGGFAVRASRVDSEEAMAAALRHGHWDIVLADHRMPRFDSFAAFRLVQLEAPDVPFIVVSGSMHEQTAVDMIVQGAQDFIPKNNLTRMNAAVERSLLHSRTVRDLRARLATASRLEGVALLCRVLSGDLTGGLGRATNAMNALADATRLPPDDPCQQEARSALENLRNTMVPMQALAVGADDASQPTDLEVLLRKSEVLLDRLVGPDVELLLPPRSQGLTMAIESGDAMRILVAMLSHSAARAPGGSRLTLYVSRLEKDEVLCASAPDDLLPWPCVRLSLSDHGQELDDLQLSMLLDTDLGEVNLTTAEPAVQLAAFVHSVGGLFYAERRLQGGMDWLVALPTADES